MANTKNKTNKSGKTQSSGKSSRKKKNSSDDTLKFLLVLVIAGIAIALIFFSQSDDKEAGGILTGTPTPTLPATATKQPEPTIPAVEPTKDPNAADAPVNTPAAPEATATPIATAAPTATPTPTPTNTPTPTPTPALSAADAENVVRKKIDTSVYSIQLINEQLQVGNGRYYQFGAILNQEFVYPFLAVNKADGTLHFYDSTEQTVFDFTTFPLKTEATPTPMPTPAPSSELTAKGAYEVLCTYSKESLHIAKEVKEYDAEYGDELTLIDGVNCYRINLSEVSNGKVRNRGEFYVSVDGAKCYYIDSDTNEFVLAEK